MEASGRAVEHDLPFVSTGHLPARERIKDLIDEAYERFASDAHGQNSTVYPALRNVSRDLFGICVVQTDGFIYSVGDAEYDFTIMSVSKPFLFALICDLLGPEAARDKLGVNATGLPFNSLAGIESSRDGRTNPMVNAGAIATTSLVPGKNSDDKWRFIRDGLSPWRRNLAIWHASPQFLAVDKKALANRWVAQARSVIPIYSWTIRTPDERAQAEVQADALIWESDGRPRS